MTSPDPVGKRLVSLPHHVPKMESLSQKLDDMRKNMGDSVRYNNKNINYEYISMKNIFMLTNQVKFMRYQLLSSLKSKF